MSTHDYISPRPALCPYYLTHKHTCLNGCKACSSIVITAPVGRPRNMTKAERYKEVMAYIADHPYCTKMEITKNLYGTSWMDSKNEMELFRHHCGKQIQYFRKSQLPPDVLRTVSPQNRSKYFYKLKEE